MKLSQEKRVLDHLQKKKALTRADGIKNFYPMILNVPARISDLRKKGFDIYGKKLGLLHLKHMVYFMEGSMWFNKYGKVYK